MTYRPWMDEALLSAIEEAPEWHNHDWVIKKCLQMIERLAEIMSRDREHEARDLPIPRDGSAVDKLLGEAVELNNIARFARACQ